MTYTDNELKVVAEWLRISHLKEGEGLLYVIEHQCLKGTYTAGIQDSRLEDWLLSPEGRVAIEDRFMDEAEGMHLRKWTSITPKAYKVYDDLGNLTGEGYSPAEAWLNAAVNYTAKEE